MSRADVTVNVVRGPVVESRHRGIIAVVDGEGREVARLGDTETVTYLRSAAKPFQTIPVIADGAADQFHLNSEELAVITGSHSGQAIHTAAVEGILRKLGLTESALKCGGHPPFDPASAARLDGPAGPLHNNCSGKHAGMLALALRLRSDPTGYDEPDHPVQRRVMDVLASFARLDPADLAIGIDGCGVPNFAIPVRSMARAYAGLMAPDRVGVAHGLQTAARMVTRSMIGYPEMVAGTHGRFDTDLMLATGHRLVAKVGAEGVHAVGVFPSTRFPAGLGIVVKIEDGDDRRVRGMVVLEALRQLELIDEGRLAALKQYDRRALHNHRGDLVGEICPAFQLKVPPTDEEP
ncbi:MAG: asparaginase [Acidobacteria bacterium]|nr:asparaginase [Acidobacteriota bacterium]